MNLFISFRLGDTQLSDTRNFIGGATNPDSFLKAYKNSETKRFFPYEWFDHPDKRQKTNISRMTLFTANFTSGNTSEAKKMDYAHLLKTGLTKIKPLSNWNYQSHPVLGLIIINTWNKHGNKKKWAHSKTFWLV